MDNFGQEASACWRCWCVSLACLVLPLLTCSCSMILAETVPTRVGYALRPGANRQALAECLGQPDRVLSPPQTITKSPGNVFVATGGCDVHVISGLVQLPGDEYASSWNVYPALVIVTLGIVELINFPYVVVDLSARSVQRYELQVCYDAEGRLVVYERTKRSAHKHSEAKKPGG